MSYESLEFQILTAIRQQVTALYNEMPSSIPDVKERKEALRMLDRQARRIMIGWPTKIYLTVPGDYEIPDAGISGDGDNSSELCLDCPHRKK